MRRGNAIGSGPGRYRAAYAAMALATGTVMMMLISPRPDAFFASAST